MRAGTQIPVERKSASLLLLFWLLVMWGPSSAQSDRFITIRMLDSKTGEPITSQEFRILFQALPDPSKISGLDSYWMEGGERHGILRIPFEPGAATIAVHSSYGLANWSHINCDFVKDRREHWYLITDILNSGIVTPNHCTGRTAIA